MNIESGKIDGDYAVTKDLQLHGMITGSAIVKNGVLLQLHGTVVNDLIVEKGGTAIINGTVRGNVINRGGNIEIYGVVYGSVNGPASIDANAVVKGPINT
jgi:cytoskeletal protein CcmA (bactofilin family)